MPKRRATTGHKNRKKGDRRITLAGRKVKELLFRTTPRTTIVKFAKDCGVERIAVHRLLNGERWRHIDVDFALALRKGTKGHVQIEDCASITAIPMEDAEKEEPRRPGSRRFARTGTDG